MYTKQQCLEAGVKHIRLWLERNNLPPIPVYMWKKGDRCYYLNSCAFYMPKYRCRDNGLFTQQAIHIMPDKCQHVDSGSVGGRNWSFPGYVIDQTPFGVLAHELGHYVDDIYNNCSFTLSRILRAKTKDKAITTYKQDSDEEWFAEIFRLFCTNPDLLKHIRRPMYDALIEKFPNVVETRPWELVLQAAPSRTKAMTATKIRNQCNETMNEDEQR